MKNLIKRFFAFVGIICFAWMAVSELYFLVIFLKAAVGPIKLGKDQLTESTFMFFNLSPWMMALVISMAAYAAIYIYKNRSFLKERVYNFSNSMFQD
ncbi:MAG: hypothetical protein WCK59_01060 [Candidatus Falkowbacteria bacterium]